VTTSAAEGRRDGAGEGVEWRFLAVVPSDEDLLPAPPNVGDVRTVLAREDGCALVPELDQAIERRSGDTVPQEPHAAV